MKHLYFIRHGETVMNTQLLCSGISDTPLTELGKKQAQNAGKTLSNSGMTFNLILSSPLSRAHDTAIYIAKAIGYNVEQIELVDDLQERKFGILEGRNMTEDLGISTEEYYAHPKIIDDVQGVETIAKLHKRAERLLEYVKSRPEETILLVSHGALLRSIQRVLQNLPYDSPLELTNNATLMKLI